MIPTQHSRWQVAKWQLRDAGIGILVVAGSFGVGAVLAGLLVWAVVGWR